jgi:Dyp-type peroxidase family
MRLPFAEIQGFAACGYSFPFARYLLLEILDERAGQRFVTELVSQVTDARWWEDGGPQCAANIAFTHRGLASLGLPVDSLASFPAEFIQGMRSRAKLLGDYGRNAPEHWDAVWHEGVHAWLGVYGRTKSLLEERCGALERLMTETAGARVRGTQAAGALFIDGQPTRKEHFGYEDSLGNPVFEGDERGNVPGHGKLMPDGRWAPLATGEFLLEYPDESGELPAAPHPHLLARNGTFMVYRKLHQNVASFRRYLAEKGRQFPGGEERLAAKLVGRWRDGTPIELSPDRMDPELASSRERNTNFTYGADPDGARCPLGAHIRRTNPRDAAGFGGRLADRHRIIRRGLPYGSHVPEGGPAEDHEERGTIFIALNASLARQFEIIQRQWVEDGNDARQGNDRDPIIGDHSDRRRFVIQGEDDPRNPPFLCGHLPTFVELRGGDYFFVPSMTALRMIGAGAVDER